MNNKQKIMIALAAAGLMTACRAHAQQTAYSETDLLLNFRDTSSLTPADLAVDLGSVYTFVASHSAGTTVDLDPASGGQFTASQLTSTVGTPSSSAQIGFSAAAGDSTTSPANALFLTRVISGPSATGSGLTVSAPQGSSTQGATVQTIDNIGAGYTAGTQVGTHNAASVSSSSPNSYQSQAVDINGVLDYQNQPVTAGAGGAIEGVQAGSGSVYEALWEVPAENPGVGRSGPTPSAPDTYEGYFTFQSDGEVDFTAAGVSAVPEPSTYADCLIAAVSLVALACRRQFRSTTA